MQNVVQSVPLRALTAPQAGCYCVKRGKTRVEQDWRRWLLEARERTGLSRSELARRASLSLETIRAYEQGRRRPTAQSLTAVLEALRLERGERNRILEAVGFAADGLRLMPHNPDLYFTLEEATEEIERYAWPAHVNNEMMEVLAANRVAQRLWGVDLEREFTGPVERNMLSVVSSPRFASQVKNWDEVVSVAIAVMRGHHRGPETQPEGSSAYYAAVMKRFMEGVPNLVHRFFELWELTPARTPKVRWTSRVEWQHPEVGLMRFEVFTSACNEPDGLSFIDWIPLDAATWQALEALRSKHRSG